METSEPFYHPGFTTLACLSLILMLIFVYSKKRFVGFLSWFLFGVAWLFNVPHFLAIKDYYNTFVMFAAFVVFTWMSVAIIKTDRIHVFVDTTAFSTLSIAIYFLFAFTTLKYTLMVIVAKQSTYIGRLFGFNMVAVGRNIYMGSKYVTLILACTGIQSMALFTGATLGVRADIKRRIKAFMVSVPVIYFLNLLRDTFVCVSYAESWFGENSFYIAHNVISKILATIALFLIAYAVFKILPELEELIWSLMNEMLKTLRK